MSKKLTLSIVKLCSYLKIQTKVSFKPSSFDQVEHEICVKNSREIPNCTDSYDFAWNSAEQW